MRAHTCTHARAHLRTHARMRAASRAGAAGGASRCAAAAPVRPLRAAPASAGIVLSQADDGCLEVEDMRDDAKGAPLGDGTHLACFTVKKRSNSDAGEACSRQGPQQGAHCYRLGDHLGWRYSSYSVFLLY